MFLQRHGLVTAARFEIRNQREITRKHEGGEECHLAERAELAGGGGSLDFSLRRFVGERGGFVGVNGLIFSEQVGAFLRHGLVERGIACLQLLRGGGFLQSADEGKTQNADGQHPDAAHRVQGERAAFRALLGSEAEHRGPRSEERRVGKEC